jgi:ribosomal protein L33
MRISRTNNFIVSKNSSTKSLKLRLVKFEPELSFFTRFVGGYLN